MVFVGEIPMVYRWYKWYIYSSWDYQPTYNLGGTTFAAKRESILKWSTVDAGTYLPFICFAIHKFKRPCSIPSSELTLNPWKVAMFNTRWCPHSYKLVSNPTPINPSYWTYLHQLSDSELGHHLVVYDVILWCILVGGLEHFFMFPNSWDDDPIWLIFFRGLKPPIGRVFPRKSAMNPTEMRIELSKTNWV